MSEYTHVVPKFNGKMGSGLFGGKVRVAVGVAWSCLGVATFGCRLGNDVSSGGEGVVQPRRINASIVKLADITNKVLGFNSIKNDCPS